MNTNQLFSDRPFSYLKRSVAVAAFSVILCGAALPVYSQDVPPVRYGDGGFAPTDLSSSSSMSSSMSSPDDMTGGVVASPLSAQTENSYQANLEVRLSEVESQMRNMRGQLEEKDFAIRQLQERLDKALADIDMRLNSGTNAAPSSTMATPPATTSGGTLQSGDMMDTGAPPQPADPNALASASSSTQQNLGTLNSAPGGAAIPPSGNDVASQYESAFSKLKSGDYKTAQGEFDRFLKANPSHQLAANATYWYGETFYAQDKFQDATRIFAESYKKYPKGPKAADSLLKLGMSLGGSGKTKEACVAFKQLKKQYPSGNSTVLQRADQEMSKLACS